MAPEQLFREEMMHVPASAHRVLCSPCDEHHSRFILPLSLFALRYILRMRVLCVGRHQILSEHLCRFFEEYGVAAVPCVGLRDAMDRIPQDEPDAVICDYDLLATMPLTGWENDPALRDTPVIAVSLTRHPGEAHLMDVNGIAGFLYLPTLDPADARRLLASVSRTRGVAAPTRLPWPATTPSVAHLG